MLFQWNNAERAEAVYPQLAGKFLCLRPLHCANLPHSAAGLFYVFRDAHHGASCLRIFWTAKLVRVDAAGISLFR